MANPQIVVEYVAKGLDKVGGESSKIGALAKKAFLPAAAALTALAVVANKAVNDASNLNEQINKAGAVFRGSAPKIVAWSKTTASALGISQRAALEAAGTFGNMLVPMGFARGKAADMSRNMIKLAADMASFNNASPEETLDALRSGLAGETEPLRKFGVFLNEARIKQEAFRLGLTKHADAAKLAETNLKAATKAADEAGSAQAKAARDVDAASKVVTRAQDQIQASADRVAAAQERLRDSNRNLSDAQDRLSLATQKTRDAKEALRATQERSKAAQLALVEARKKATEQLQDLRDASIDAGLSEERAGLALRRARERLAQVTGDSESSELDRAEALLAVKEAERGLAEASKNHQKTTEQLAAAEKAGVEGSAEVVKAKEEITAADEAHEKAAQALQNAQKAQARALAKVDDALRGVVKAQLDLRRAHADSREAAQDYHDAQDRLSTAQEKARKASANLAAAQDDLTKAQRAAEKAGKAGSQTLTAQQKAMATYSIIMKDTKDTQGDFARTSGSLANQQRIQAAQMEDLSATIGNLFLPLMQKLRAETVVLIGWLRDHWPEILAALKQFWTDVKPTLEGLRDIVVETARLFIENWESIKPVVTAVKDHVEAALKLVGDALKLVAAILRGDWGEAWQQLKNIVVDAFKLLLAELKVDAAIIKLLLKALAAIGEALLGALVAGLKGIGAAAWGEIEKIGAVIGQFPGKIAGWGSGIAASIKSNVVATLTGIGSSAWEKINNIGEVIAQVPGKIASWGTGIGASIRAAAVAAIVGIGNAAWDKIAGIGSAILGAKSTIIGWGEAVGSFLKSGFVNIFKGIGTNLQNVLVAAINTAIKLWNKLKIPGFTINLPRPIPDVHIPGIPLPNIPLLHLAKGGIVTSPTLALIGERGPEAVVPLSGGGGVEVRVFIGETELRGMVRTEVRTENDRTAQVLLGGLA